MENQTNDHFRDHVYQVIEPHQEILRVQRPENWYGDLGVHNYANFTGEEKQFSKICNLPRPNCIQIPPETTPVSRKTYVAPSWMTNSPSLKYNNESSVFDDTFYRTDLYLSQKPSSTSGRSSVPLAAEADGRRCKCRLNKPATIALICLCLLGVMASIAAILYAEVFIQKRNGQNAYSTADDIEMAPDTSQRGKISQFLNFKSLVSKIDTTVGPTTVKTVRISMTSTAKPVVTESTSNKMATTTKKPVVHFAIESPVGKFSITGNQKDNVAVAASLNGGRFYPDLEALLSIPGPLQRWPTL